MRGFNPPNGTVDSPPGAVDTGADAGGFIKRGSSMS